MSQGVTFRFGSNVEDIIVSSCGKSLDGVKLLDGTSIPADVVVLAIGHSSRALYSKLLAHGIRMEPKPIAVGFRKIFYF